MAKRQTKTQQWAEACAKAKEGLDALVEMQQEYQEKLDNLPENLQSSPYGTKLEEVCGLNLEDAQSTVEEAEAADLPLGFGRD